MSIQHNANSGKGKDNASLRNSASASVANSTTSTNRRSQRGYGGSRNTGSQEEYMKQMLHFNMMAQMPEFKRVAKYDQTRLLTPSQDLWGKAQVYPQKEKKNKRKELNPTLLILLSVALMEDDRLYPPRWIQYDALIATQGGKQPTLRKWSHWIDLWLTVNNTTDRCILLWGETFVLPLIGPLNGTPIGATFPRLRNEASRSRICFMYSSWVSACRLPR